MVTGHGYLRDLDRLPSPSEARASNSTEQRRLFLIGRLVGLALGFGLLVGATDALLRIPIPPRRPSLELRTISPACEVMNWLRAA